MRQKIKRTSFPLMGIAVVTALFCVVNSTFHSNDSQFVPTGTEAKVNPPNSLNEPSTNQSQKFLHKIKTEDDVKQQLIYFHARFNEITGWDNLDKIDEVAWSRYKELNFLQDELYLRMSSVVSNDKVKLDLTNAAKLVKYARDNFNTDAIIYAHRIIHDLDFYVLATGAENIKGKDKFGASFALPEHNQAEMIDEWIKENVPSLQN